LSQNRLRKRGVGTVQRGDLEADPVRFGTTTAYLLMDAGKLLFGKERKLGYSRRKEWVEKWLKVTVRVFMKDL
jgi:hypothetical protein